MGHLTAALFLCATSSTTGTAASSSGGGLGINVGLLAVVVGAFTAIGVISALVTFVLARRTPVTPAPIPVWNYPRQR